MHRISRVGTDPQKPLSPTQTLVISLSYCFPGYFLHHIVFKILWFVFAKILSALSIARLDDLISLFQALWFYDLNHHWVSQHWLYFSYCNFNHNLCCLEKCLSLYSCCCPLHTTPFILTFHRSFSVILFIATVFISTVLLREISILG